MLNDLDVLTVHGSNDSPECLPSAATGRILFGGSFPEAIPAVHEGWAAIFISRARRCFDFGAVFSGGGRGDGLLPDAAYGQRKHPCALRRVGPGLARAGPRIHSLVRAAVLQAYWAQLEFQPLPLLSLSSLTANLWFC